MFVYLHSYTTGVESASYSIYGSITNSLACIVRVFNKVNVLFLVVSLIGTHLIEHIWHSHTPEQLNMRSSMQVYDDLKNPSSSDILAVDKFVFSFTNGLVFEEVILWNPKLYHFSEELHPALQIPNATNPRSAATTAYRRMVYPGECLWIWCL